MKKAALLLSALLTLGLLAGCTAPPAQSTSAAPTPGASSALPAESTADWNLVRDAYVFTFPLVLLDATARVSTNTREATDTKAPVNQFIHSQHLADADAKNVVTPNVDTLYSQAFLNLEEDALVFHRPAADRFLSVEILDAYTNSACILGTGGDGQEAATYLLTGPDYKGDVEDGMTRLTLPTNTGWMIIRTMVESREDLENVYALQGEMQLLPLEAARQGGKYTPEEGVQDPANEFVPVEHVLSLAPEDYFSRANELLALNAPSKADAEMMERLSGIAVGPGMRFDPSVLGEGANARWKEMLGGLLEELLTSTAAFQTRMGAWSFYGEPIAEFGTEYDYRALVALDGLGANPVSVAVYPKAETSDDGAALDGSQPYRIHFEKDALPPTLEYGFWSITAYGEDRFLIDNDLDRYLVSDRSDLALNEDGSLDIFVSSTAPEDPALQGNWLPVTEGAFHLYLRIYLPNQQQMAQGWQAPAILRA